MTGSNYASCLLFLIIILFSAMIVKFILQANKRRQVIETCLHESVKFFER